MMLDDEQLTAADARVCRTLSYVRTGSFEPGPTTACVSARARYGEHARAAAVLLGHHQAASSDDAAKETNEGNQVAVLTVGVLMLALPSAADAQMPQARDGFWFNAGLGYGSLGCEDCESREGGLSGGLSLGTTLSSKLLVGVGTTAWTKEEDGARLTAGTLTALVRFYPSASGGLFFVGGLGLGSVEASFGGISARENGGAAVLGLGYDYRFRPNMSITPFWNGAGISASDVNTNYGQIGLG
ncbi:MAG: hypothetical protein ACREK1_08365, partial [Longimicrobiales bacterium]